MFRHCWSRLLSHPDKTQVAYLICNLSWWCWYNFLLAFKPAPSPDANTIFKNTPFARNTNHVYKSCQAFWCSIHVRPTLTQLTLASACRSNWIRFESRAPKSALALTLHSTHDVPSTNSATLLISLICAPRLQESDVDVALATARFWARIICAATCWLALPRRF